MAASTKQSHRPNPAFWLKPVCVAVCSLSMIYCTGHIALGIQHIRADKNWKYPNPDGLLCGLAGAGIGQICCVAYQYLRRQVLLKSSSKKLIQLRKLEYSRSFVQDVLAHMQRVELFLLVPYLSLTWMFSLMPESYYDIESPCNFFHVLVQLLVVDFFTYVFHVGEHTISRWYILTHKAHHKFTNPQLFNGMYAYHIVALISLICLYVENYLKLLTQPFSILYFWFCFLCIALPNSVTSTAGLTLCLDLRTPFISCLFIQNLSMILTQSWKHFM